MGEGSRWDDQECQVFFSTSWLYFPQGKKGDICRNIDSKVLAGKGFVTFKKGMGGLDDVFSSLRCNFRVCADVHVYVADRMYVVISQVIQGSPKVVRKPHYLGKRFATSADL